MDKYFVTRTMKISISVSENKQIVSYDLFGLDWDQILSKLNPELFKTDYGAIIEPMYFAQVALYLENYNRPILSPPTFSVGQQMIMSVQVYDTRNYNNTYQIENREISPNTMEQELVSSLFGAEQSKSPKYPVYSGIKQLMYKSINSESVRGVSLEDNIRFMLEFTKPSETLLYTTDGKPLSFNDRISLRIYSDYFQLNPPTQKTITTTTTTADSSTTTTAQDISAAGACKKTSNQVPKIFIDEKYINYKTKTSSLTRPVASPSCRPEDQPIAVIALAHSPTPPPTNSPTATHTNTPTPTPTLTQTPTNTATTTQTPTNTTSATATVTPSTTVQTPTPTASQTSTPFSTPTQSPSNTSTPIPTTTPTQTVTSTTTTTPTNTTTPSPTPTRGCVEGESFDVLPLPVSLDWRNIEKTSTGETVITDREGTYIKSLSLFTWSTNSVPNTAPDILNDTIKTTNGIFVGIGKESLLASQDLENWTITNHGISSELTEYTWNKILYVEELGQKYFMLPTVETQQNGVPAPLAYSKDLLSWGVVNLPIVYTSGTENRSRNFLSGAYGNGIFVLGTDSKEKDNYLYDRYQPVIMTSFNGVTWTPRSLGVSYEYSDTFNKLGDIQDIYHNGLDFVAIAVGTRDENGSAVDCARVFQSPNGINWTQQLVIDGDSFVMTYGGTNVYNSGKFLLVANNKFTDISTIYYSLDGLWWIIIGEIATEIGINKIKSIDDTFYAVSNDYLYVSRDCPGNISY